VTRSPAASSDAGLEERRPPDVQASALGGSIDGMLAEYVVLEEEGVVRIPTPLSVEEGATLPCAALTAWHALVEQREGHCRPDRLAARHGWRNQESREEPRCHGSLQSTISVGLRTHAPQQTASFDHLVRRYSTRKRLLCERWQDALTSDLMGMLVSAIH
jgi:hypothetical protein